VIENGANIDYIHLPSQALKGRVEGYCSAIPAAARMKINPENSLSGRVGKLIGIFKRKSAVVYISIGTCG
jgi:hypothetical protein